MKRITVIILSLCLKMLNLEGHCPYDSACQTSPQVVVQYILTDLGPSGLSTTQLSRLEPLYTLAPSINNRGQILYNTSKGAYWRDPHVGEFALSNNELKVYSHALNNEGDAVVSLERVGSPIEWMRWSFRSKLNGPKPEIEKCHIAQLDKEYRAFFCAINDNSIVTGYREEKGKLHPLIWSPRTGLHPLGYCSNYYLDGFPRGINRQGSIVGYFEDVTDSPPFVWECTTKLQVLYNYRNQVNCQGWIELADMVIGNNNEVYGTYVVKYISKYANPNDLNSYFTYRWQPDKEQFEALGFKDMRIAAINNSNTLVGSLRGHAMIRHEGGEPVDLNTLIANAHSDWTLLEATSINDLDHIVGFGTLKGEIHLFLLEPTR